MFTIAIWFGFAFGAGFLAYAVAGTSMWSDATLDFVPVSLALKLAFGLLAVAGCLLAGLQFGWFEPEDEPVRRTRRTRSTTRRRRVYR